MQKSHQGSIKPRLTCEACTRRKVKCDKKIPCTNCERSGVTCIPVERQRLPRGRHLNRRAENSTDADLRNRLARLENLVLQQNKQLDPTNKITPPNVEDSSSTTPGSRAGSISEDLHSRDDGLSEAYRAFPINPFAAAAWTDDIPERTGPSESLTPGQTPESSKAAHFRHLAEQIPSPQSIVNEVEEGTADPWIHQKLCEHFVSNVDPVFKILHTPSVIAHLIKGGLYLNYTPGHPSVDALDFSIFYAAIASLTHEKVTSMYGVSKKTVLLRYRLSVEAALSRADFILTEDLTVLQAFTLYLVATRSHDRSRRVWTLVSLAIRLAQGLNIHVDTPSTNLMRPFDREMAKRLWWSIGLLDVQGAMERGTDPIISCHWLNSTALPLNINDADFSLDSEGPLIESREFTDTTLSLVGCKAQALGRLLNFPPTIGYFVADVRDWYSRHQLVEDFRIETLQMFDWDSPGSNVGQAQLRWHLRQLFEGLIVGMQLDAVRPLRQQPIEQPPNVKGSHLLRLAVTSLQKDQVFTEDRRNAPWLWFSNLWAPWHALAVALSELTVCEDVALMKSCYGPVKAAFSRLSDKVIDSHSTLWGPMENLMETATLKYQEVMSNQKIPLRHSSNASNNVPPQIYTTNPSSNNPSMLPQHSSPQSTTSRGSPLRMTVQHTTPPSDPNNPYGFNFDGTPLWPSLDHELDLMCSTSASHSDTAAWANWDSFIGNIRNGDDFAFTFG